MGNDNRLYKGHRVAEGLDPAKSFVMVDSADFNRPCTISLERIGQVLEIKINEDIRWRNISSVEFSEQESNPQLPPDTLPISTKTHISVDENYLYVWVAQSSRWKRIPLSDWNQE
jgi:hypothetical protein